MLQICIKFEKMDIKMNKLNWSTEKRKVLELIPSAYNPRILTEKRKQKLIVSLTKFSLVEIPAINKDNTILAGHQRVKVMMDLGMSEDLIDVRVPNRLLTEQEAKEYNITSNIPVGFWDLDLLDDAFADVDLEALGLNVSEIEIPADEIYKKEEEEGDFVPVIKKQAITQLDDVYEFHSLDKKLTHKVICGSSTTESSWLKILSNKKLDLIVTDPPYNVDYTGGTKEKLTIQNDNMSDSDFYNFLLDFYSSVNIASKQGAGIYVFHADSEGANFRRALIDADFKLAQCLIWVKNSIVMGRQDYQWKHEPILYGWKKGAAHKWESDRTQTTVLNFDKPLRNGEHPTMKPLDIIEYLIKNSSKRKGLVGDGFLGSGSTLVASEKTKRNCYGCELDERFVDVIVRRWHTYMISNGLDFKIYKNGTELKEDQIKLYYEAA